MDADFPPFYKRGSDESSILQLLERFKFSGIFLHNSAARVGGTAEVVRDDRSWCQRIGVPVLEAGLNDAASILGICTANAEYEPIVVELTTGDENMWMYLKVRCSLSWRS